MSSPLPFLKEKPQTGVVAVEHRESGPENHGLLAAATELLRAIEAKDAKGVAMAFQNAFELLESSSLDDGSSDPMGG
jgi:hypothetical protein